MVTEADKLRNPAEAKVINTTTGRTENIRLSTYLLISKIKGEKIIHRLINRKQRGKESIKQDKRFLKKK